MKVEWRTVVGFSHYEVSSRGRVRRAVPGKRTRVGRLLSDRALATGGYPIVVMHVEGRRFCRLVHRLVLEAFVGPCPHEHEANHKDGVKTNNHVSNLEWVTKRENLLHRSQVLGKCRGESHGNAVLTPVIVRDIRRRRARGEKLRTIAARYRVSEVQVSNIARRRQWAHVL